MGTYTTMALAWVFCIIWIGIVIATNRKAHPKVLFYLFFVEMWERFSYYGMRALLVLYMTSEIMDYNQSDAYGIYGAYGGLVYATPLVGGLLAERFMGYRKAIVWGAFLMMVGHFLMAIENEMVFLTCSVMSNCDCSLRRKKLCSSFTEVSKSYCKYSGVDSTSLAKVLN